MWFPVDDGFHSHPKAQKAGDEALGMWVRAGSHCMAYLTDGFVAEWWVKQQPKGVAKARKLVDAELWRRGENDGEPGWWFHDWKPENLKVNVLAARESARQRKAKSRERSRVTDHVTDASVPSTTPHHTTPHHSNTLVTSGGGVTSDDASDPRPECPEHGENFDGPCRRCAARRRWDETHAVEAAADELERKRAAKAAAAQALSDCPLCDTAGWLLGADGTPAEPGVKCTHNQDEVNHG